MGNLFCFSRSQLGRAAKDGFFPCFPTNFPSRFFLSSWRHSDTSEFLVLSHTTHHRSQQAIEPVNPYKEEENTQHNRMCSQPVSYVNITLALEERTKKRSSLTCLAYTYKRHLFVRSFVRSSTTDSPALKYSTELCRENPRR